VTRQASTWDDQFDLVVLGTGAAGLSAALTAASEGLRVLVLEKTELLGGTTAYSAGTVWAPGNSYLVALGLHDDIDEARRYLDQLVGSKSDPALRDAYLETAPEMLDAMADVGVRFWHAAGSVDYHPDVEGAGTGRALEPETFDARQLSRRDFARVRPPVPEFALFGGSLMVRRAEVNELLTLYKGNVKAVGTALRLGIRWMLDRLTLRGRGTRLAMGNGLTANMFHQILTRGGQIWFNARTSELISEDGRIVGVVTSYRGRRMHVRARLGVVLATGGFAASQQLREQYLPTPTPQFTPAAEGATGDAMRLAQRQGAAIGQVRSDNAMWFPGSVGRRADGTTMVFPHIWDRAKPGLVAVNADGRRFVDESVSYHRFVRAMYAENEKTPCVPAWLIVDSHFLKVYGLGAVRPYQRDVSGYVKSGYLYEAPSIAALAEQIGVDADGLQETVEAQNRFAGTGKDEEFGKGDDPYGWQYGDPDHKPNVNLGSISKGPYYALSVVPTPLATSLGLRIDTSARVLDTDGLPIGGLYSAGIDADSVMSDEYPGPGCQVGGGMTFGYIAAKHAAGAANVDA
jgi:3-oxosteroid 1-dehydrogenase